MLRVLSNRTYRHLLAAQVVALLGTRLATVALGLLAFELASGDAGAVLGTALAIKIVAYVGVAHVASAFTEILPRRATLVVLNLVRAVIAALLPFVTEVWQVYERYGHWSLVLSWLPVIGDPLTLIAGVLRTPLARFLPLVIAAKVGRYVAIAAATTTMNQTDSMALLRRIDVNECRRA